MELKFKMIAVLCNYELLQKGRRDGLLFFGNLMPNLYNLSVQVDWFSNKAQHMVLMEYDWPHGKSSELFFLDLLFYIKSVYTHIIHILKFIVHLLSESKQLSNAKIIVVDHNLRPLKGYSLKENREEKGQKVCFYCVYISQFIGVGLYTVKRKLLEILVFM
jgi:hypothetical protein